MTHPRRAGDDSCQGGRGNDVVRASSGHDRVDGGAGLDEVDLQRNAGVAFNTLPAVVQSGLTTLAQGASISTVLVFHDDGQTYYGTIVPLNQWTGHIVVDSAGNAVTDAPSDHDGGSSERRTNSLGSVVSVDTVNNTITLNVGNENATTLATFNVTTSTSITNHGASVALSTLTVGTLVKVQTINGDATTAASIKVAIADDDDHQHAVDLGR